MRKSTSQTQVISYINGRKIEIIQIYVKYVRKQGVMGV